MITHSVFFRLKHRDGSPEERDFLAACQSLASLPMVRNFRLVREVSPKNPFRHGLVMEFADAADYRAYDAHPRHADFVASRWLAEVAEFQEIDYQAR